MEKIAIERKKSVSFEWKDDENMKLRKDYIGNKFNECISSALQYVDRNKIVTSSFLCQIFFFEYENGKVLTSQEESQGDGDMINGLIKWNSSDDDETFLSFSDHGMISEWSLKSMKRIRTVYYSSKLSPHKVLKLGKRRLVFLDGYHGCLVVVNTNSGSLTFRMYDYQIKSQGAIQKTISSNLSPDFNPFFLSCVAQNRVFCGWDHNEVVLIEYSHNEDNDEMWVRKRFPLPFKPAIKYSQGFGIASCSSFEKNSREILVVLTSDLEMYFFNEFSESSPIIVPQEIEYFRRVFLADNKMIPSKEFLQCMYKYSNDIFFVSSREGHFFIFDFSSIEQYERGSDWDEWKYCLEDNKDGKFVKYEKRLNDDGVRGLLVNKKTNKNSIEILIYSSNGIVKEFSFFNKGILRSREKDIDLEERTMYVTNELMLMEQNQYYNAVFHLRVNGGPPFLVPKIYFFL